MTARHIDRAYEGELRSLRERILEMAGRVEEMIQDAMRAVVERDEPRARRVIELDQRVNALEVETDELCLTILARRQPLASDLRFITLALKMVTDLERIGDLAVNISERALELAKYPALTPPIALIEMGPLAQAMVRDAIDAFVHGDAEKARLLVDRDDELDERYHAVFRGLLAQMMDDVSTLQRGIHLQAVAKFLERIGDHGTNLAEEVVFLIKGKDIRHVGKRGLLDETLPRRAALSRARSRDDIEA